VLLFSAPKGRWIKARSGAKRNFGYPGFRE
jgi:hypothetical protein